jgi:hypothetical protein
MRAYLLSPISTFLQDPQEPRKNPTTKRNRRRTMELQPWRLAVEAKQDPLKTNKKCQAAKFAKQA